ncbi:SusC/RagA family TonB-linked outer membrane protein [Hymenobacter sp. HMF4947]|uniref:SusC/RagA family TonB-linked outer membrane protein n=1 Tax=Hymenobacter ginkgonis TaxID=2682976 RepID=A0A7K1TH14_9BACT|nr:TonB-dependent receptor [Hymenobacter ginkgonis]MVN77612.1 SusC/RagA family TonB-linked outer membrane protein [Hymenobacter ginkgonis]
MKNQVPFSPPLRPLLRHLLLPAMVVCLQTSPALAHKSIAQTVLERAVTLQAESQPIKAILSQLTKQTKIHFVYSQQLVGADRKVSVRVQNAPLATVLDEIFAPLKIEYEINHDRVVLRLPTNSNSANDSWGSSLAPQAVPVTGKVVDAKGTGLPGVTVLVKGTTNGTSTGADGNFTIQAPENSVLVFSFVGYTRQELPVTSATTSLTVTLVESAQGLNDVVVIGYGTARKSDLTGAVASVNSAQLTQVATSDPVQALQGRVAGVEVTSNSGQPGSGTRIRVRGVGTINNSDPLYVVDGIQTSDIGFLLPTDIESTEILKDASATAIYGSRGANGVVLITTKHGKAGATQFNLFGYTGFQQIRNTLPLTNAAQYSTLVLEAFANAGKALPDYAPQLQNAIATNAEGIDYQKLVTQKGLITNYSLSASGGTEQNRYLVSGSYFQQNGIIQNSGFKKFVLRVNDDVVLTKRIKAGVAAIFTNNNQTGSGDGQGGSQPYTILQYAQQKNPVLDPFGPNGTYNDDVITRNALNVPRLLDEQQYNKLQNNNLFTSSYVDVSLFKGLSFRSTFGINYFNNHPKVYQPQYYIGPVDQRAQSALVETRNENVSWVWSNYFNYNKTFGDNSNLSFTLGQEAQRGYGNGISITAYNVPLDATLQYASASRSSNNVVRSSQYDGSLSSYFGRANYNFRDRYLLTATLRFDQTSKFLGPVRTGTFPSVGAAWNISNESFLKDVSYLSVLKLRASYGQVGNQNAAPNYGYASVARNNQTYVFNNLPAPGLAISQINNPDLKWETAITTDVGLDAEFFNNKLTFTADYFERRTQDMIALLPVPDYVGQAPASANVGSLRNRGLELALNYRNAIGKLQYNVGVNFTKINNVVTSLGGGNAIASGNVLPQIGNTTLTDVGREVAFFYGLQAQGVFHNQSEIDAYKNAAGGLVQPGAHPGDVRYQDTNGDGQITASDNTYLGSATPSFSYGASLNLNYSGFDFKVLLYGVQGAEAINGAAFNLSKSADFVGVWSNFYASRLDRWTPSNPNSDQPRVTSNDTNGNDRFSSRYVENASYLRARNMELGYTLPQVLLGKVQVKGARVFASVDNVFTITKYTGYDPEISTVANYNNPLSYGVDYGNYPQARTYRLGFNVQF